MADEWKAFEPPTVISDPQEKVDWMGALAIIKKKCGSPDGFSYYDEKGLDAMMTKATVPDMLQSMLRDHWRSLRGIVQSGGAVSPVDPEMKELMKRLETTVLEQAKLLEHFKRDHHSYSFSKIPASWQRPFQFDLLGRDETCAFLSLPKNDFYSCIDPYDWDPKMTEHQQMDGILAWLKKALFKYKAPKKSSFPVPLDKQYYNIQDRHGDTQVLKFALDGANYRGGVDILILDREREKYPWQFTYVVIEIKTPSVVQDPASVRQWEAELIGSCIASKYPVISVLTDLDKHWSFQWFSAKGRTTRVEFDVAGDAIAFLRLILQPSPTKGVPNYALPVAQVPLETAMPQFSLDSHQTSDVAQLMDLLPFLAGEERYEISREISKQVLFSMYI